MPSTAHSLRASPGRRWPLFGRSVFFKQLALYLLLIALLSGVFALLFFAVARQHLEEEVGRKLQYIARISARNAPFERLELIRPGDDEARMVLRLKEKLADIQESTGVRNIFVFRPDMHSLLDLEPGVRIGERYRLAYFTPEFARALEGGQSTHTQGYLTEQGEIFVSACAPVLDPEGRLFAVVGVDAGAGELEIIEHLRTRLYWTATASIALALLLALFFARSITRPIRHMAATAEKLGRGEYTARASVASGDELGSLAESINRMAEQVRNRDAALKEMAASVAHEIRNPLNSIKLLVALLEEELAERQVALQGSTLETIDYEIGKLNRFIDEFLTYARPVTLIRDCVRAADIVSSVLDMAAAGAREREVELVQEGGGTETELSVDRLRLEQTLLNIVLNAIQACGKGGRVVLRTEVSGGGEGLDFAVEDNGSGIGEQAMAQLFEPFFTTRIDGTGLGLANARKIIEEHGGSIRAENRPKGGARFVVHLPRQRLAGREGGP